MIISSILLAVYGLLMVVTVIASWRNKKLKKGSLLVMLLGGLLLILSIIWTNIWLVMFGLLLIHISAIWNGLSLKGKLSPGHHFVRLVVSVCILLVTYNNI